MAFIYKPYLSQSDLIRYEQEYQANETFKNVFKYNITQDIKKEMHKKFDILNGENHNMIVCYGLTGKGKSIAMISLAREIYPAFRVDNIFFHNQQILENLKKMSRPDWIIRDENVGFAQFGSGSGRIPAQVEMITQTLRKRCISFTFISAPLTELETAQYYFKALDMDKTHRVTRFGVQDPLTKRYLGAFYQKVMEETDPFWMRYNEKKEEFMQAMIEQDFTAGKPVYQQIVEQLLMTLNPHIYTTKKERKMFIAESYKNLTRSEIEELATLLEIKLRERDDTQKKPDHQAAQEA